MVKPITIKFYTDPGHGWAAVKRQVLFELGIADSITPYSYQNGGTVYLEEDLDLPLLINTLKSKSVPFELIEKHTDNRSPIRTYNRYKV